MKRVKLEYSKAGVMGLFALAMVAVCILARTFDAVFLVIMASALTWYFAMRGRAFARIARRGCGRRPS